MFRIAGLKIEFNEENYSDLILYFEYLRPLQGADDKIEELEQRLAQLNSAKNVIENILYWETCPEKYKEKLAFAYDLEHILEVINKK